MNENPRDTGLVDERPLEDCLPDYWRGTFTLRDESAPEPKSLSESDPESDPASDPEPVPGGPDGARGSALAALGPSGITVRGRDLATLLEPAYRAFTA
ncbi:hypothetical protein [Kitasatospora sp. NBC_00315]|uniref:hypothetical protein n=1 Tax=Kitasatospora sp. NBC_00315 TaxID=2975963 RepID=UPI0032438D46